MNKKYKKKLILLDAHAIIHRAYHALPDFSNSKGEPTGALYGIITMILKIAADFKPEYIVACYDLPGKTFRHEAYDQYKGSRKKSDDDLKTQLESSRKVMKAFNIPMYDEPGFEADDMLGTLVEQITHEKSFEDIEIIIASGDMDTLQLAHNDRVRVFTLKKGINDTVLYDEQAVMDRFGFGPALLPDYKGLRGDASDNIPGVPGIGEKTATTLITNFGTLESLYKKLKSKDGEKIFLDLGITPRFIGLLKEHEEGALFSKMLAVIRRDAPVVFEEPKNVWRESLDFSEIEKVMGEYEFRALWKRIKEIFGLEESGAVTPIEEVAPDELYETGIGLWLLNSEITEPKLDDILHHTHTKTFAEAKKKILADLKEKKLEKIYTEIELPLVPIIKEMSDYGILIDRDYFEKLSKDYHVELSKLEEKIYALAGMEFNIKSPKQLGEVLFDKMMLTAKGLKKTAGGARSTRESELEKLRDEHEIIPLILAYREIQKLLSTYIDTLPKMAGEDGRIRARFSQAGTTTGRFSSNDPNLQNIPIKSELGKNIRNGFIAPPGSVLAAFDYSQIELRCAAILADDKTLIEIFQKGKDVHTAVAAQVFGVSEENVDYEMRRRAKVINFGIIYGMGVNALKENLGSTRGEAQEFYNQYFENFPSIREYLDKTKAFALEHGYTETLLGRRRYFPALNSKVPFLRASAERMAINAPIQGTATADIIKIATRQVHERMKKEKLDDSVKLLLQIHDELIFEVKEEVVEKALPIIKEVMEGTLENSYLKYESPVPLVVNTETGDSWGTLEEFKI